MRENGKLTRPCSPAALIRRSRPRAHLDAAPGRGRLNAVSRRVVRPDSVKTASSLPAVLLAALLAGGARGEIPAFDRYQVILDRKPFGEPPPPESLVRPVPPSESFAKNLRLCALLEVEDGGIRVGLVNLQSNQNFFLGVGDVEEGIELVSADYDDEEAVLRKGSEMAVIKLQSGDIQPLTQAQHEARVKELQSRRPTYAERRRAREAARRKPVEPPKYTGEELEKHLKEYQMEVIRQGLPPLPIPLTPEMDQQLVDEGVLPPVE